MTTGKHITSHGGTDDLKLSIEAGTELNGMYCVDEPIAMGGMAEVYRGHNIQTKDPVAIKIVLQEYAQDEMILGLFRKEAQILFRLTDDAIVRYYGISHDKDIGRPYLAMEFVDGPSLADQIKQGPLDPDSVHALRKRMASGLQKAHELGVIHRDISPDNIILPEGRVDKAKIIDFGIARADVGGGTLLGGHFAGKYNFVSPEQLGLFSGEVTPRSDMYSLGLVLAAALLGEPIDMNGNQVEVIEKRREVPDLSGIDADSREIISAMLQPNPDDRPRMMLDVANWNPGQAPADELKKPKPAGQTKIEKRPEPAKAAEAKKPPAAKPARTAVHDEVKNSGNKLLAIFAMLLLLVAAGLGGWYYYTNQTATYTPPTTAVLQPKNKTTSPTPVPQEKPGTTSTPSQTPAKTERSPTEKPEGINTIAPSDQKPDGKLSEQPQRPPADKKPPAKNNNEPEKTPGTKEKITTPPVVKRDDTQTKPQDAPEKDDGDTPTGLGNNTEPVKTDKPPATTGVRDYVRNYDGGSCFYVSLAQSGPSSASIVGFGTDPRPFVKFSQDFQAANGFAADIQLRVVSQAQCVVVENLAKLAGRTARPVDLALDFDLINSNRPLQGRLANVGSRKAALLLIDNEGFVYNLGQYLKGQGNARNFKVVLRATRVARPKPQLVLALATPQALKSLKNTGPVPAERLLPKLIRELSSSGGSVASVVKYFKLGG